MMTENPFPGSKIVPGPVKHDFQKMTILIFPPSHLINPQASKRATDGIQIVEGSHIVYSCIGSSPKTAGASRRDRIHNHKYYHTSYI